MRAGANRPDQPSPINGSASRPDGSFLGNSTLPGPRVPMEERSGDAWFPSLSRTPMSFSCELWSRSGHVRLVNKRVSQQAGSVGAQASLRIYSTLITP